MHCVSKAEDVAFGIFLGHDLVDVPLGDVDDLGWRVISNELLDSMEILLVGRVGSLRRVVLSSWEQDKHPLVPRPDHADDGHPPEARMLPVRLHDPVEISLAVLHQM